ncbi:universal stress protein [Victivallis vadensis]|uniref:Two-component system sensor histidine kinase KdpD n=1 Tax=Victivallis vadensis TaxID=172901 RepID=A0A2U1AHY4_9BACT|nr:universal stress protein [Victivallis vadensis]NMD88147.1 universal stress protein [Victivallis vadensis]PVY36008.1 two-component system sensor histidine kinase KdpD [Victivallis vadensis]HJH05788.1 universal stress protein [Victivallis vadensis]
MEIERADRFLRLIRNSRRGRLKIYLGYCAGVGKTTQMLKEAQRLKHSEGVDVAVGLLETHGRAETAACLGDLEVIPCRVMRHRNIEIAEMDVPAILARRPQVVLVDELAHTNVPGSKHEKRYQDVEEILDAGIHVISTLNIQHLESLYEIVEKSTGVKVRERIPDWVVTGADEVVNVDVSVDDLRERIRTGRVYPAERIGSALDNFFRAGNLQQLRELTLRELAAQLDTRYREKNEAGGDSGDSVSPDQVMVCMSSLSPNADALLRYGSRLAGRLNRNWYVLYVQTSRESALRIDAATQRRLADTLELARQVGAKVFTYQGDDVVKTILQFAREHRVGHIIMGPSGRRIPFWRRLFGETSLLERLTVSNYDFKIVVTEKRRPE